VLDKYLLTTFYILNPTPLRALRGAPGVSGNDFYSKTLNAAPLCTPFRYGGSVAMTTAAALILLLSGG
jgi:hypothetical protein